MNFFLNLIKFLILLQCWQSEAVSTTYSSRQTNRKQKKLIEGSMDLKAQPCNDFYDYACGKWDEVYYGAGINFVEPITMLDHNVNIEMSRLLNRLTMKNKPNFLQNVNKYYESCKNLSKYELFKYLQWLKINEQFKWPAIWTTPKKNTQFDWLKTLAKMRTYGLNDVFIQQIFISKTNDVNKFVIDLDKPVLEGGFKPLKKENLKVLLESLPAAVTAKDFENLWSEIEEFEQLLQELDEIEDILAETEDEFENLRAIKYKDLPLEWLQNYLKVILNQTHINPEMELYIQNKPYLLALDALLQKYDQRFLNKYLEIRFLWHLHVHGPANFIEEDCISNVRSLMPIAMHWLYEQQHADLSQEYDTIYEIFNKLRQLFGKTIQKNVHAFNSTIVQYLQNKLDNMKLKLNNIPRVDTVATLEKFYQHLNLDENNFYENHLKLLNFNFKIRRALLDEKQTILGYTYLENAETGASSSPFFVQNANTVFIPLTLLQQPIYHPHLDDIYKYSSLGFLLAHEMFHGFDDSGLLTNANGTLTFIKFEESPLFNASLNCLLEINPVVISEKIADISGLRYAYQAFFDTHPEALSRSIRLHGLEVPMTQVFFLNFAQFFCGNITPEEVDSLTDHGSDRERVMDALTHFPEFSQTYKCTPEDRLYPHETCRMWRR